MSRNLGFPIFLLLWALATASCGISEEQQRIMKTATAVASSNSAAQTAIAETPQTRPIGTVVPQEVNLIPGQTTAAQVKEVAGEPKDIYNIAGRTAWWYSEGAYKTGLYAVTFDSDVVYEVIINVAQTMTANQVVSQFGPPEVLWVAEGSGFNQPKCNCTQAPPTSPGASLVYASKGFRFDFSCRASGFELCDGIRRNSLIEQKTYFKPMGVSDWIGQEKISPNIRILIWTGFMD